MVLAQKCECGGFYVFSHFGGPFPSGKEREEEFCPHCKKLVYSEMTSGCTSIRPANTAEISECEQEKARTESRRVQSPGAKFDDDDLL